MIRDYPGGSLKEGGRVSVREPEKRKPGPLLGLTVEGGYEPRHLGGSRSRQRQKTK